MIYIKVAKYNNKVIANNAENLYKIQKQYFRLIQIYLKKSKNIKCFMYIFTSFLKK